MVAHNYVFYIQHDYRTTKFSLMGTLLLGLLVPGQSHRLSERCVKNTHVGFLISVNSSVRFSVQLTFRVLAFQSAPTKG